MALVQEDFGPNPFATHRTPVPSERQHQLLLLVKSASGLLFSRLEKAGRLQARSAWRNAVEVEVELEKPSALGRDARSRLAAKRFRLTLEQETEIRNPSPTP